MWVNSFYVLRNAFTSTWYESRTWIYICNDGGETQETDIREPADAELMQSSENVFCANAEKATNVSAHGHINHASKLSSPTPHFSFSWAHQSACEFRVTRNVSLNKYDTNGSKTKKLRIFSPHIVEHFSILLYDNRHYFISTLQARP